MDNWILVAIVVAAALLGIVVWRWWQGRQGEDWPLVARPLMTADEARMFDRLRAVFPEYQVFTKVPLSRFMRLRSERDARMWFDLINPLHVTFVLLHPQSRMVVGAIDLVGRHGRSASAKAIKQHAFGVCNIRYLALPANGQTNEAQLRHWLRETPAVIASDRGGQTDFVPLPEGFEGGGDSQFGGSREAEMEQMRGRLGLALKARREQRNTWQQDSFIAPHSRIGQQKPDVPL